MIVFIYYLNSIKAIQENWPEYRCNPMYMPFASDVESNFTYCIQSMQNSFMGNLLQPITFATSSISNTMSNVTEDLNYVRAMFDKIRTFFTDIVQQVFGVFLNLIIEFQKITIGIKDMVSKLVGLMTTVMYLMDGTVLTMQSAWNGPPGQLVQALGKCFHPNTQVKLQSGEVVPMKKLRLGAVLEGNVKVVAVMKIDSSSSSSSGSMDEPLYVIKGKGVNGTDIYVTGSHMIYDEETKQMIEVKNYKEAVLSKKKTKWFSCLITDTHRIPIGEKIFWDWEDYALKLNAGSLSSP